MMMAPLSFVADFGLNSSSYIHPQIARILETATTATTESADYADYADFRNSSNNKKPVLTKVHLLFLNLRKSA
jgi:hypothetical protein